MKKEIYDMLPNFNFVKSQCSGKTEQEQMEIVKKELLESLEKLNSEK